MRLAPLLLALLALPAAAQQANPLVEPILAEAGPGTRWGIVVADEQAREIVAIEPQDRFIPASNTKLFTTAAALWAEALDLGPQPEQSGASVRLEGSDVVLTGHGDARLSSDPACLTDCLAALADAVAAKTKRVRNVIGDDTLFPDERWSTGMSWNNIPSESGTAISALTLDDNVIVARVAPGKPGLPPIVSLPGYYTVEVHARTVPGSDEALAFNRQPGSRVLVVSGTIGESHAPIVWRLGVDDPADRAAWVFRQMLVERGVRVSGTTGARHRPYLPEDDPELRKGPPPVRSTVFSPLAQLEPAPLAEDVTTILKVSQNLHAELLLRRLGLARGTGSVADGSRVVKDLIAAAGLLPQDASLSDGSGMSTYNRVTPRGTVKLLQFIARQPWASQFADSLPVGGVDGTLKRRFVDTLLAGRIRAKTGTLNATNALAGWFTAASGKRYTFAIYANDVPGGVRATASMDKALVALAAAL